MLDNFDPTTIEDVMLRQLFITLLNLVEQQTSQILELQQTNQALRDELARLKGGSGKPDIKANLKVSPTNISSEQERRTAKPRLPKPPKQHYQAITRTQTLELDQANLPSDAISKGYEEIIVRELHFEQEIVCFQRHKYYSPSQQRTYLAPLPPGFDEGAFGAGVHSFVISLYHESGLTQPKIEQLLQTLGCPVSTGLIAEWVTDCTRSGFEQERSAMEQAGLASSEWHGIDDTSTRVGGSNKVCEIICNPLYTTYHTLDHKDRHSVLALLCGGQLQYRYNEEARALLRVWKLPEYCLTRLEQDWPNATSLNRAAAEAWFELHLPGLGPQNQQALWNALGIAYYHWQQDWPVISLLVCDDAPQWEWLTSEQGLCWIHEGRHYKKLSPHTPYFASVLAGFQTKFWAYYRELLVYRSQPSAFKAEQLDAAFEKLFGQATGYELLDKQIAKTKTKKAQLLMVLQHPEIPLHNNASELAARQRVRKRDISFGPRNAGGVLAWDVFQSLVETCHKLGISFYRYIHSRLTKSSEIAPLAETITARAKALNLSGSWATM